MLRGNQPGRDGRRRTVPLQQGAGAAGHEGVDIHIAGGKKEQRRATIGHFREFLPIKISGPAQIPEYDVRSECLDKIVGVNAWFDLADHGDAGRIRQQRSQTGARQRIICDEQDPNSSHLS
jgi:hypothetical protein